MRIPYQVLIFPFVREKGKYYYAIFKRKDLNIWQGIAGGGEGKEKPIEAARREAHEEASIKGGRYIRLASVATIPAANIHGTIWGKKIIAIPELAFGVELPSKKIKVSGEHTQCLWLSCEEAIKKLKYDSNKTALWELNFRLKNGGIGGIRKNVQNIKKFL